MYPPAGVQPRNADTVLTRQMPRRSPAPSGGIRRSGVGDHRDECDVVAQVGGEGLCVRMGFGAALDDGRCAGRHRRRLRRRRCAGASTSVTAPVVCPNVIVHWPHSPTRAGSRACAGGRRDDGVDDAARPRPRPASRRRAVGHRLGQCGALRWVGKRIGTESPQRHRRGPAGHIGDLVAGGQLAADPLDVRRGHPNRLGWRRRRGGRRAGRLCTCGGTERHRCEGHTPWNTLGAGNDQTHRRE